MYWVRNVVTAALVVLIAACFAYVGGPHVGTVLAAVQGTWKEFVSAEGGFAVLLPGPPTKQKAAMKRGNDTMDVYTVAAGVQNGTEAYVVTYSDFPALVIQKTPAAVLLTGARDGVVKQQAGKLLADRTISLGECPGRRFRVTSGKDMVLMEVFLVKRRLYQVVAVVPAPKTQSQDVERFFKSFKIAPKRN